MTDRNMTYALESIATEESGQCEGVDWPMLEVALTDAPDKLDYTDFRADNLARASWAARVLRSYSKKAGLYEGESIELCASDFLNDLRHLLDLAGVEWEDVASPKHYDAEIRGEL